MHGRLPSSGLRRVSRYSGGTEYPLAHQVNVVSAIHLPPDELQLGDLTLTLALAPLSRECRLNRIQILAQFGYEPGSTSV
jgi:hypothetical protein